MKPSTKKKVLLLTVLAAAILGWQGWTYWQTHFGSEAHALTLYGNVDVRQVELSFRVSGRIERMNREEGDSVKAGDLLALLDKKPYEDEWQLAQAQLAEAQATLSKLQKGNRSEEMAQAQALVSQRQATFDHAQLEFNRQEALYSDKVISKRERDEAKARYDEARAALESAREASRLSSAGFRDEDIAGGIAAVQAANARLEQAKTRLNDTALHAPADGMILTRVSEPGAVVAAGQTVYALCLHTPVWVRAYVDEPELGRVRPGMKALIYTDSEPNKPYTGQIGFISPEAEFTPKAVETPALRTALVYRLRIIADNPGGLRQGMPVTVKLPEDAR